MHKFKKLSLLLYVLFSLLTALSNSFLTYLYSCSFNESVLNECSANTDGFLHVRIFKQTNYPHLGKKQDLAGDYSNFNLDCDDSIIKDFLPLCDLHINDRFPDFHAENIVKKFMYFGDKNTSDFNLIEYSYENYDNRFPEKEYEICLSYEYCIDLIEQGFFADFKDIYERGISPYKVVGVFRQTKIIRSLSNEKDLFPMGFINNSTYFEDRITSEFLVRNNEKDIKLLKSFRFYKSENFGSSIITYQMVGNIRKTLPSFYGHRYSHEMQDIFGTFNLLILIFFFLLFISILLLTVLSLSNDRNEGKFKKSIKLFIYVFVFTIIHVCCLFIAPLVLNNLYGPVKYIFLPSHLLYVLSSTLLVASIFVLVTAIFLIFKLLIKKQQKSKQTLL